MSNETQAVQTAALREAQVKRLKEIQSLTPREMYSELYKYLCVGILGYPGIPTHVEYQYDHYDNQNGSEKIIGPGRMTDPGRVPTDKAGQLDTMPIPEGVVPKKGDGNFIHGQYTLTVLGVSFTMVWGPEGAPQWSPELKRNVTPMEGRPFNFPNGVYRMEPSKDPSLYAWIEMHPSSWNSPVRKTDLCIGRLGELVTCEDALAKRNVNVKSNLLVDVVTARVELEAGEASLLGKMTGMDDAALRNLCKRTNVRLVAGVDLRKQYVAHLGQIIKDRTGTFKDELAIIRSLVEPDLMDVEKTIRDGFTMEVITYDDGEYFLNGEIIDDTIVCPANMSLESIDFLVTELRARGNHEVMSRIDRAVTAASNDTLVKARMFVEHDRLIDKWIADGHIKRDNKSSAMTWVCGEANNVICKFKKQNDDDRKKKQYLLDWAHQFSYEQLVERLEELSM